MRELFLKRKKKPWTQMNTIYLQPITLHKLEKKYGQKTQIFSKKNCSISFFLKGFLAEKNMELEEIFGLFLEGCLSSSLKGQFISSLIFFKTLE